MSRRCAKQGASSASEDRYALAIEGSRDAIWDWDIQANEFYFSPRYSEMLGERAVPATDPELWYARAPAKERGLLRAALANVVCGERSQFSQEFRLRHADGAYRWFLMRGAVLRDERGRARRMAGFLTDITEFKRCQEQLLHDAFHDALTGLPNRELFMDRLGQAIRTGVRRRDHLFAVLFLDLDGFKRVNDSLGHACGDALLKVISERFEGLMRHEDTLARLSGDEFAILLEGIGDIADATLFAERVLARLEEPFVLDNHSLYVGASIGIALSGPDYSDPQDLLSDADVAMYHAKSRGKGCFEVFDERVRTALVRRLRLETDLRHAIEHDEFRVFYQPIMSVDSGRLVGCEALVRWERGAQGLIPPAEFIPVAEDANLITLIEDTVLRTACRQLAEWRRRFRGAASLSMGINISCKQLLQNDLAERIQGALAESYPNGSGRGIILEITESAIMQNLSCADDILQGLKDLGVALSIDDFGTGYSSLSNLHAMPLDLLQIDRSFVSRMHADQESLEIVKTVINLGRNLGLKVIAEGVENDVQLAVLRELRCYYAQGFLFSRPVPAREAERLIAAA
jgi:diguanylate cyclase (GGDEF)-like protein